MKFFLLSLFPICSTGFLVVPSVSRGGEILMDSLPRGAGDGYLSTETDPHLERVKDCAEHFGKCSMKEIKELKEGLRTKRIQEAAIGSINTIAGITAPETVFEQRLLEEELSLQLSLLEEEFPPHFLFREGEDHPPLQLLENEQLSASVKAAEQEQMIGILEEEGVFESLAICALIGLLTLVPQFLS